MSKPQKPKLSAAIRIGCKIAPRKITGYYMTKSKKSACAFGAALLGIGCDQSCLDDSTFEDLFDVDTSKEIHYPSECQPPSYMKHGDEYRASVFSVVTFLNDKAGWAREAIAHWLEEQGL